MIARFIITENRRAHLLRHMQPNELAGSHFYPHVFGDPEALIHFITAHEPVEVIQQRDKRFAFCFASPDGNPVGSLGLAKRKDMNPSHIARHVREGYTLNVARVHTLPETLRFCVIADETAEGFSIITAFPGEYARPFAQKGQPREEYELNRAFWEEHILLMKHP